MQVEPYRSACTVFWIVDNGSSHAGETLIKRMTDAYHSSTAVGAADARTASAGAPSIRCRQPDNGDIVLAEK